MSDNCCSVPKQKTDWLLWGSLIIVLFSYVAYWKFANYLSFPSLFSVFAESSFELLNKMWWGIVIGILFVGIIDKIPRDFISSLFAKSGVKGIWRAVLAGVMLDLCSHGILMVGMKLYQRGIRLGQLMAFLIASPWNSFSLTLILWSLIGFKLMFLFLILSMAIAMFSGFVFDLLVDRKVLPKNPNALEIPRNFEFWPEVKNSLKNFKFTPKFLFEVGKSGFEGSKMVLRWVFFGILLASLLRVLVSPEDFAGIFGASATGLAATIVLATVLEVCSEGATPIAADMVTRAGAPGNGFAFLMTGVSTDYTEIMSLKDTTKSWKIALFLPLVTLPQVIIIAWILNHYS